MNIFWAIILGVVQGATEFFPVSSSAHLSLFPYLFKFNDPGLAFDIALHAGTFFAILLALKDDWLAMAKSIFKKGQTFEKKLILFLILTSIPGAFFGYFFEEKAETIFRTPILTASVLIIFGLVLYFVDKLTKKAEKMETMDARKAFLIGLSQALALIPGVSRSGATITAGRALGLSREAAVRYSFLAALPIIAGASLFGLKDVQPSTLLSINWVVGFAASFVASLIAIKLLLSYVRKNDFKIFTIYRIVLATIVLLTVLTRG